MRQAIAVALVLASGVALAEPDPDAKREAARLFEEGRVLATGQAKFAAACDRFAQSLELDHAPGTELNLGDCHEHLGHLARAWRWFDDAAAAFDRLHDGERAAYARARADALAPRLAAVTLQLREAAVAGLMVTIAGRHISPAPEIHELVDPGKIAVHVEGPGLVAFDRTAVVDAGTTTTLQVELAPIEVPPPHRQQWRLAFYISTAVALAAGALDIYGVGYAQDAGNQLCAGGGYPYQAGCSPVQTLPPDQVTNLREQVNQGRTMTVAGSLGIALGAGVAVVSLYEGFIARAPAQPAVVVVPAVGHGAAGAFVMGGF